MTEQPILGTIRASSWPSLFDCAMRFYYQNILGLRMPSSGNAHLGTSVHAGTALFDKARMLGTDASAEEAVEATRETLHSKDHEVAWDEDLTIGEADQLGVMLTAKYCAQVAPTRNYAAVELECEALDIATEHGVVRVTGTTDRIRIAADGRKGISDLKTGKRATEKNADGTRRAVTSGHHLQLGIYTLMAEQSSGEKLEAPAEIIGMQTTKETPIATGEVADCVTPLVGTEEHPGLITMAAKMLKDGSFAPNPKSVLCSPKFCAGYSRCIYKG